MREYIGGPLPILVFVCFAQFQKIWSNNVERVNADLLFHIDFIDVAASVLANILLHVLIVLAGVTLSECLRWSLRNLILSIHLLLRNLRRS